MGQFVQSFYNLFSPFFYYIRYRNKSNPFRMFRDLKIEDYPPQTKVSKGIVLITPIRVSPGSNLFEGLIGTFFRLRGYDVRYFFCNQELNFCENISSITKKGAICSLCLKEQREFRKAFKSNAVFLHQYLTNSDLIDIKEQVGRRSFEVDDDYIFNNVNLKDAIVAGVMRYTQKSDVEIKDDLDLVRKCAITAFVMSSFIIKFKERNDVYKVITSHGLYSSWGAMLDTAKCNGLDVIVWGRGYIGQGNMLFGHGKAIQQDLRDEPKSVFDDIVLTKDRKDVVRNYFFKKEDVKSNVDYVNYYKGLSVDNYDVSVFYGEIKKYDRVFGMFTNIPWDGQTFNKSKAFPTTRVYLRLTIEWFKKNPNCLLVIRAHPAEVNRKDSKCVTFQELLLEEYPVLPKNVLFLGPSNPITSYEVSKHICCAIMYGSSMDIELALRRIPVVLTGQRSLKNKDIAFDVDDTSTFYEYLDRASRGDLEVSDQMYENAWKYGYYWITKRNIPDSSCTLSALQFVKFNFKNKEEFLKDEFLNLVFNKIVTNQRIVKE